MVIFIKMLQKDCKNLLTVHELRKIFFPAIGFDMITGFNIYPKKTQSIDSKIIIRYLHNKLTDNDEHKQELTDKISKFCGQALFQKICFKRIQRLSPQNKTLLLELFF